ncbi:MAG: transcriptional regulator [Bacteroidetes bacterium]|nr:MAG: transcriptional regulator [Bacteroidota bacterium]
MKTTSLDNMIDKHIGKVGSSRRDTFENELRMDLIGHAIREARIRRNLTQKELGELVGVQKAQISKLENSLSDARLETILKVFKALNAKIQFRVEL